MSVVMQGEVRTTVAMRGAGDAAAKVDQVKERVGALTPAGARATSSMGALKSAISGTVDAGKGFASVVGTMSSIAGAVGTAIGVVGALAAAVAGLADLFGSREHQLASFGRQIATSAEASRQLSWSLSEQAKNAEKAFESIDKLRIGTLNLAAANARALGDEEKAKRFLAQAGAVQVQASADETDKSIGDDEKQKETLEKKRSEARLREFAAEREKTMALEARARAVSRGDGEAIGIATAAAVQAATAERAAQDAQRDADRVLAEIDERLKIFRAKQKLDEKAVYEADLRAGNIEGVEFAEFDALEFGGGRGRRTGAPRATAPDLVGDLAKRATAPDLVGDLAKRATAREDKLSEENLRAENAAFRERLGIYAELDAQLNKVESSGTSAAATISTFAGTLARAVPDAKEFGGALAEVSSLFEGLRAARAEADEARDKVEKENDPLKRQLLQNDLLAKEAQARKSVGAAALGSVGAIARAGAEQIKSERLRAGVLSIIELGLGFASVGMQDYGAAAAHFAAAAILGSVALFSGSGGGKGKGGASPGGSRPIRDSAASNAGQPPIIVNVNAPWFGPSPQESAAGLAAHLRRADGQGFEYSR